MARTKTLADMRLESLQLADMENSSFVDTTLGGEVDRYLNEGISELYDTIMEVAGHEWFLASSDITVTSGTQDYTLPADFYILKGVDLTVAGTPFPLRPYMFYDRHTQDIPGWDFTGGWGNFHAVRYRLHGSVNATSGVYTPTIRFIPEPLGTHTVTVWYVPHAPVLNADGDVWDGFNGWEEYPVIFAAIRMLEKEESDASHLHFRIERLKKRIEALASSRDMGWPEQVVDVETWQ